MTAGQSLEGGAAGVALLHLETGNWPAAAEALRHATIDGVTIAEGAGLFYGAPALAFVLTGTDHPALARARAVAADGTATVTRRRLDAAHRRIDRRAQPHYAEYDLISGLTGLGVVLRRLGHHDPLRDVLTYLVRLTEPVNGLPGWWCWNGPDRNAPIPAGGHANFGIAHGITGPLALLALTLRDGITVNNHAQALQHLCHWLDTWQQHADGRTWWPQTLTLTELHRSTTAQQAPLRPSWCYGTPGIARAQQLAAQALHDQPRQRRAETAFISCITDPTQTRQIIDRSLCHGSAGLLTTARRIHADALTTIPVAALERLHSSNPCPGEPVGFLDGRAGADLAATGTTNTAWDACLLLA
ncbi:lanthionine synthetase C family protein [Dactylosporangium sp. NPDC051485]|uniref:lanthionine synthetase C family protein n=1 Tax=Dactylosporangium sp. NPDC051485 TaxID=3154846 RepID=UPI003445323E